MSSMIQCKTFIMLPFAIVLLLFLPAACSFTSTLSCPRRVLDRRKILALEAQAQPSRQKKKKPLKTKNVDIDCLLAGMGLQTVPSKKSVKESSDTDFSKQVSVPIDTVDLAAQLEYARNGHSVLRNLISPNVADLAEIRKQVLKLAKDQEFLAWKQKVLVASNNKPQPSDSCQSIEDCQRELQKLLGSTDDNDIALPFLQYFNTWRTIPQVKDLAYSLGQAASILMDVGSVRLYQDAIFWKRRDDGPTPWHVDARMAPFDTSHMITFWIPLQNVDKDGTGLMFCSKSHADFALPYWNPVHECGSEWDRLQDRYPKRVVDYMPMKMGDVTMHSGWTLHCSNGNGDNSQNKDRVALAITFVDAKAEIRPDWKTVGDNEDSWSYQRWCKDVKPRTKFTHELVPVVWPKS